MYAICADDSRESHGNWDKQRERYWKTSSGFVLIAQPWFQTAQMFTRRAPSSCISSSPPPPLLCIHLVMSSDGCLDEALQAKFHCSYLSKKSHRLSSNMGCRISLPVCTPVIQSTLIKNPSWASHGTKCTFWKCCGLFGLVLSLRCTFARGKKLLGKLKSCAV